MMEQSCAMKVLNFNSIGPMVWQQCWIEGKILNNIYSGTAASIYAKLDNYNLADMQNIGLKFQPDRPRNLAARII